MERVSFTVSFVLPENASVDEARDYVADAVSIHHRCYRPPGSYGNDDPGDPMFDLDSNTVQVSWNPPPSGTRLKVRWAA